jgi:hypothetical protein
MRQNQHTVLPNEFIITKYMFVPGIVEYMCDPGISTDRFTTGIGRNIGTSDTWTDQNKLTIQEYWLYYSVCVRVCARVCVYVVRAHEI